MNNRPIPKNITHALACSGGVYVGLDTETAEYWKKRGDKEVYLIDDSFYVSLGLPYFTHEVILRRNTESPAGERQ